MQTTYIQIQNLIKGGLGDKLGIDPNRITYISQGDSASVTHGYVTGGVRETINIPDEYMTKADAHSATEFLTWLELQ